MKIILITFAVFLCGNIHASQATDFDDFFKGFFNTPSVNIFESACNAKAHVCAQTGGKLSMESVQSNSDDNYKITMLDSNTLEVVDRNSGQRWQVTPTQNPLNPSGKALNVREYTKGTFKLDAIATKNLPILTYYAGFDTTDGDVSYNLWTSI
ncbi:uncharacterized protein LOC129574950 [Sitodiplosis mosellana]|uniref:uncharacterized protein LOC129574950 n=1 Tax=Sitodiplosis mosellana TaxID=263140 RepID=UPI00244437D6|nr:uncharacterized protein LOC129574950 [Sitodiplosis mosellana]